MHVVPYPRARPVAPFGDLASELPVVRWPGESASRACFGTLAESQAAAVVRAGLTLAVAPPPGEPYVLLADDLWVTPDLLRAVAALGRAGRTGLVRVDDTWARANGSLVPDAEHPGLAVRPAGAAPVLDGEDLPVELQLREHPLQLDHPAFAHASRGPVRTGLRMSHRVRHWSHVLRANLLALAARAEEARHEWESAGFLGKLGMAWPVLARAGWPSPARVARAIAPWGRGVEVHPTAIVEASELGDGVRVGPFAILRGCVVGAGARIDEYASAQVSVIGPRARLGRGTMMNLCVMMEGSFVSSGGGYQVSVFGRDSFVAMTTTMLDLSFGATIRVDDEGGRADTGEHFLGGAVGHRARVGAGVRIGYGVAIPSDVMVAAPAGDLVRVVPPGLSGTLTVRDGVLVPAGRGPRPPEPGV